MKRLLWSSCVLLIVIFFIKSEVIQGKEYKRSFINPYPRFKLYKDGGNPGEPLFLTPLIHDPSIPNDKVRAMASVKGNQFLNVEGYSGYLTVNRNFNSNMFFWYFPAEVDPITAPVVLWLQGGPGASSLFGLFTEIGPFEFKSNGQLAKRNYTWSKNHNLIFIDNPVGTGFSFTDHEEGYAKNEKDVGRDLHEAMMQLFELFDWGQTSGFWITGESYAGKYVPALAYHIHKVQNSVETRVYIPLKGIAMGNGFSDPIHQLNYGDYLYQLGFLDDNALEIFHKEEKKGKHFIGIGEYEKAFEIFDELIDGDMTNGSIFHNITGFNFYFNFLKTKDDSPSKIMGEFLQASSTRKAIHVGNKTFHDLEGQNKVEEHLKADIMASVAPWVAELLDSYTVCIYNGQLDIIVAYSLTRNYLNNLKFKDSEKYKKSPREIWYVNGEIAGYVKHAGHLVELMVRNAGHMAPTDQPAWMFELITHLTHYKH